ncbi:hypothetical protein ANCCAN_06925 [Ancylostoma caninum]|uniref:Uncharacterized protein n=1 Tax=Ancylostoma caninum TaxID=29170 RepID=A0A368GRP5_ANCCA|nr:hypothetical protein ANCCAN_06925 [Ancylostoma caninum]
MNLLLSWEMQWYFDHCQLHRYLVKGLREIVKVHLMCAVDVGSRTGDPVNMKHFFNISLYHIAGIHNWDQNEITDSYTSCLHGELEGEHAYIPIGSAARYKLRDLVLEQIPERCV